MNTRIWMHWLSGALLGAAAAVFLLGTTASAQQYTFAVSQGWIENESGQHLKKGFEQGFKDFGGTATFTDANYDPKKQSEQIEAFIKQDPDALFVTAADTAAIAPTIRRAIAAGIPVFSADSMIPGAAVITTAMSNNYGMGYYTAEWIARRLDGKGKVAMIDLPSNETWDMRALGFNYAMRNYPDIEVVAKWSYDPTSNVTPRQAVDNILTAHPDRDDLHAIWCAWDGAAMEGALAIRSAGRAGDIFTTGIDGGKQAFQYIKQGTPMQLTMAQSFYDMAYSLVYYAHQHLEGNKTPRLIVTPTYAVTQQDLKVIRDDYDNPRVAKEVLGWQRDL